jgi:ABC-2 type transport system permease protein
MSAHIQPRTYGAFNTIGFWTLYTKEVKRFFKVGTQTVLAPVVTTLLYMLVFVVALGSSHSPINGVTYAQFLAPGLIMMAILNNAFANASSSIIQAKIMGTAGDFLMPPLSALELTLAFVMGAATRGVVVGLITAITILPFTALNLTHLWAVVFFGGIASVLLGTIGVFGGLWSEKFDHLAAITNFVVMPMTFLSGTFYFIDKLPEPFLTISHFNPFFYLIDGFRYGFIGVADGNIYRGVVITLSLTVLLIVTCYTLIARGWRLKS